MRFCTTHRACEVETGACAVAVYATNWELISCTLVDALIVTKDADGSWPDWTYENALLSGQYLNVVLDALERAEP